jgi:hypothetical protein
MSREHRRATFEDTFSLLCGAKIGGGIHRTVYECTLRPDLVVKVENNDVWRHFANVHEMKFWSDNQHFAAVAKWLAPCDYMSPDGRVLLQRRVQPLPHGYIMPEQLPGFLTDWKRENYGLLDNRFVCVDYAMTIPNPSRRLRKVTW